MLDLATTPEGKVQLVTTNFDRLFEACHPAIRVWQPPRLPDPSRPNELDGLIHLHGRTDEEYYDSEGEGFVLSTAEFGRAYLSDGWATRFFKEILDLYVVVFVGYTADDPPALYLLEALNRGARKPPGLYAFQIGTPSDAAALWSDKGVEAIAYPERGGHQTLWKTLEAWAERARAPETWYTSVIDRARRGPAHLQPHERGQVAHVVSTIKGAQKFSEGDSPPPADWLYVFDPRMRYDEPDFVDELGEREFVDPFDLYGLDSDVTPRKSRPRDSLRNAVFHRVLGMALQRANWICRTQMIPGSCSRFAGMWQPTLPNCHPV